MTEILRVENLTITYYSHSGSSQIGVKNINFSLNEGEIYGIVGESGSGKSTILLAIMGLLYDKAKIEGKIYFKGKEIQNLNKKEMKEICFKEIGLIFQNQMESLNPSLTIEKQILEILRKKFSDKNELQKKLDEVLEMVGLELKNKKKYPHELSGGMRQRVFIAMGICLNPPLLLIDEPTTALEEESKKNILNLLKDIKRKYNTTMLIISHDFEVIEYLTEKVLILLRGNLIEKGRTEKILEEPKHPYTFALLQSSTFLNPWKDLWGIREEEDEKYPCPFYKRCTQKVEACLNYIPYLKSDIEEGVACYKNGIEKLLVLRNIKKLFKTSEQRVEAVRDCSLCVRQGEIVALLGKSGSGKTTLLRIIAGLLSKDAGEIYFFQEKIEKNNLIAREKCLQIIEQDPFSSMNPSLTVEEIIAEPTVILHKKNLALCKEIVVKNLKKVGLETNYNFLKKQANELSGGQRQKVAIARALSMEPKLLLADEISSMLDESGKLNIMRLLKQLQHNIGFSVLLVTHDITLAKKVADYIYYMDSGCIIEEGSVRKIFCKKRGNDEYQ